MKIVTLTFIRNEADIIESLCRYTCSFIDHMVIYDDESQDDSKKIVKSLIDEGLPITLFDNSSIVAPSKKELIVIISRLVFTMFKADWLLPLDADEFIGCISGGSPRLALESMSPSVENQILWRSYICENQLDNDSSFLPHYFTHYREGLEDEYKKASISKELYNKHKCVHYYSSHYVTYPVHSDTPPQEYTPQDLFYAHYPLRSKQQALIKVLLNRINYELYPDKLIGEAFHYTVIFKSLMEEGAFSMHSLREASLTYGILSPPSDIKVLEGTLDTKFCDDKLTLRYTTYANSPEQIMKILSCQLLQTAEFYGAQLKAALDGTKK